MNILIDTHVLLWHITNNPRLTVKYKEAIENKENEIFVSKISLWEIVIKHSLSKLELKKPILEFEKYFIEEQFQELDFDHQDLDTLSKLPFHHRDPFDRLIISQAVNRNIVIITDDSQFKKYPVQLL